MNIGLDMMGGDYAPQEAVKGVAEYLKTNNPSVHLTLIGDEQQVDSFIDFDSNNITVVHAPEVIGMHEHPTKALREKPKSSISIGFQLLASGKIDAFISAGNTGTMLVGALFSIKAIEGVLRPTISTVVPKVNGGYGLLLDVGLNADCKPENLLQFAVLASFKITFPVKPSQTITSALSKKTSRPSILPMKLICLFSLSNG